jgi:hypothetical protein
MMNWQVVVTPRDESSADISISGREAADWLDTKALFRPIQSLSEGDAMMDVDYSQGQEDA